MRHQFDTAHATGGELAGIAASTEAASISLLAAIDGTVDAMRGIASIMGGFSKVLAQYNENIKAREIKAGEYIDDDGAAVDAMASAASSLQNFLTKLVVKRTAIDKDARLKEHHCEALHDAYEEATSEVAELVEMVLDTRASIITHDLAAEPRDGQIFQSVEELIEDLKKA